MDQRSLTHPDLLCDRGDERVQAVHSGAGAYQVHQRLDQHLCALQPAAAEGFQGQ